MAYRNGRLADAFILIALGFSATAPAQTSSTLYERLGGTPVVTAFVADAIDKVNLQQVKGPLTERICTLTGGSCAVRAHGAGHRISPAEFSGLVEALRESMRARDVPLAARNQLLEILAPMNGDVVTL
jgi:truncated hemoglobin YjbI